MADNPLITFVLPYFNEAEYIGATLRSLAEQEDRRFSLVLVDNASADASAQVARDCCHAMPDIAVDFLHETRPGKIHALATGMAAVTAPLVGTLDADTVYPSDYVARVRASFARNPDAACVIALATDSVSRRARQLARLRLFAAVLPRKCHSGGCGQSFRRDALDRAGGFDPAIWPYVLEDHEIIHRVTRLGALVYDRDLLCNPSDRRSDRSVCSWTLSERVMYKLLPAATMDWFFYRYLAVRFERRGLNNLSLRARNWADQA